MAYNIFDKEKGATYNAYTLFLILLLLILSEEVLIQLKLLLAPGNRKKTGEESLKKD